ncbi:daptide biosynthesis RiPP recognition protein [Paenarthrobacter sp. NPDC090520]|uniref:daptide biosynthesis RiPP recognition protein n=1 Tax=Paenarthrobacter sp. NPDC090520 TaxID=3364382 RepID=UPI0038071160
MTLSQQQTIAAAVDQWVTGIPGRIPGHVVFAENPAHAGYAKDLAVEGSVVLVVDGDADDPDIVLVKGSFDEPGGELLVGGTLNLEIQDYVALPFVNLVGATVVRITGLEDQQAFFDDADEARSSGHFIVQLTEVNAVLSERGLLGGHGSLNRSLSRIHITADGTILNGPYGTVIGWAGDPLHDLRIKAVPLKPESAVASISDAAEMRAQLSDRPWIPRYLAALDAWKFILRDHHADTRLVGFGLSLYGATESHNHPLPGAPFILERHGEYRLLDTKTGRLFKIGADAATLIEAISNLRDVEAAATVTATTLGVSPAAAEGSARSVVAQFDQLGIDLLGELR